MIIVPLMTTWKQDKVSAYDKDVNFKSQPDEIKGKKSS